MISMNAQRSLKEPRGTSNACLQAGCNLKGGRVAGEYVVIWGDPGLWLRSRGQGSPGDQCSCRMYLQPSSTCGQSMRMHWQGREACPKAEVLGKPGHARCWEAQT